MIVSSGTEGPADLPSFDDVWDRLRGTTNLRTQADLAADLDIKSPNITKAKQRQYFPFEWAFKLATKHQLSLDYLLRGDNPMQAHWNAAKDSDTLSISHESAPRQPVAISTRVVGAPSTKPEVIECMDCHLAMIPMVEAQLSAGTGSFVAGGEAERRYAFRSDFLSRKGQISQMVLMRVSGDSMEPEIYHNDVVLIDQSQTTPRAGTMFAVAVEDLVYIKMVDTLPGKIILRSLNPVYAPLEIDARGDLADGIRIVGKAIWMGREMK